MSAQVTEEVEGELTGDFIGSGPVNDLVLDIAVRIYDRSGVDKMHEERLAEHAHRFGAGGRNLAIPVRAAVTVMLLNAIESPKAPLHVVYAADTIAYRLNDDQRARLGIDAQNPFEKHRTWVDRLHAALDQVFRHIDPYSAPNRRSRYTKDEWTAIVDERDPAAVEARMGHLYAYMNALVQASVMELPYRHRRKFRGHRAVDGTSFKVSARGTTKKSNHVSVIPTAWWYRREGDHKVENLNTEKPRFYGFEATLFTWCKKFTSDPDDYPNLCDAIGFNPPGRAPHDVVTRAAGTIHANPDLPVGPLRGDLQYWAGQNIDKFHRPMWDMGFTAVTDYRPENLGLQGEPLDGMVRIDGDPYCPSILKSPKMVTASLDYKNGTIDYDKFVTLATERGAYLVADKEKSTPGGKRVVQCPAAKGQGALATLACPVKTPLKPYPFGAIPLPISTKSSGAICDNKSSLTIQPEHRTKFEQEYRHGTREWFNAMGQREVVENFNRSLKYGTALGNLGSIRLHGYAAHYFLVTLSVIAVNVHRINDFIAMELNKKPRRKKTPRAVDAPYSGWHRPQEPQADEAAVADVIPLRRDEELLDSNKDTSPAEHPPPRE